MNYPAILDRLEAKTFGVGANPSMTYVPMLFALQVGATIAAAAKTIDIDFVKNGVDININSSNVEKIIPTIDASKEYINRFFSYINSLSKTAKYKYVDLFDTFCHEKSKSYKTYFADGLNAHRKNDKNADRLILVDEAASYWDKEEKVWKEPDGGYGTSKKRVALDENNAFLNELTRDVVAPVLVMNGTVFAWKQRKNDIVGIGSALGVGKGLAKFYLDTFLKRIKENYAIEDTSEPNTQVQIAEVSSTSDDIRVSLYCYLKKLYDKWVPMNNMSDWEMKRFFDSSLDSKGHNFHFIDSFYNKIGDKLLVNGQRVFQKINSSIAANDYNANMMNFLSDVYGENKCQLLCIQNFLDMSNKTNFEAVFKPIPFEEMGRPKPHPDFVVVYPYEPSSKANISNGEFKNDSFLLSNEEYTPKPIRTKKADDLKIPAFGVSYGKQYQSYFKNITVGMDNPIVTEQAMKATFAIIDPLKQGENKSYFTTRTRLVRRLFQ